MTRNRIILAFTLVLAVFGVVNAQAAPSYRVILAGDIACKAGKPTTPTECHHKGTSDLVLSRNPTAVLIAGDLQYGGPGGYASSYAPTWGRFKARTWVAQGNHDWDKDEPAYFSYWRTRAGQQGKGYYGLRIGSWQVLMLNSNLPIYSSEDTPATASYRASLTASLAQEAALRKALASAKPGSCQLAVMHHPRWSIGMHREDGDQEKMAGIYEILYDAGVDVLVVGHDHEYQGWHPLNPDGEIDRRGVQQFVVGTGGASLREQGPMVAGIRKASDQNFGVLELNLAQGGYGWQFLRESGPAFTDTGTRACH